MEGLYINIIFSKDLSEEEQLIFWKEFISFIEKYNFFYGGGHHNDYFKGYIEIGEVSLSKAEEILMEFINSKREIIKNFELKP